MNIVLLMMGGKGTRLGSEIPKQYLNVNNIPIFVYVLNMYEKMPDIDKIMIVPNAEYIDLVKKWIEALNLTKVSHIISADRGRNESIKKCLEVISQMGINPNVLIHDATHPYVDTVYTKELIKAIDEYGAATLVQCNYDTVYEIEDNIITKVLNRNKVVSGASPEGFKFDLIYGVYKQSSSEDLQRMTSAGALAVYNGIKMRTIETDLLNLKITFKRDLELYKKLINCYYFKEDVDTNEKSDIEHIRKKERWN